MASKTPGKFEVDVTALGLGAKDLAALNQTIQSAVLSHLAGVDTKPRGPRIWGWPGRTDGIWILPADIKDLTNIAGIKGRL